MQTTGIICEYNPLHLGHRKQIAHLKALGHTVVCLMSGNFVQRGHPAIFDKMARAQAAIRCGADLVLELPVQYALSSAEGFAAGGVEILSKICDNLCFGAETADTAALMATAHGVVGAPEGVKNVQDHHPNVEIFLASLDEKLNEKGYIVPGLGDCGDRLFGTK